MWPCLAHHTYWDKVNVSEWDGSKLLEFFLANWSLKEVHSSAGQENKHCLCLTLCVALPTTEHLEGKDICFTTVFNAWGPFMNCPNEIKTIKNLKVLQFFLQQDHFIFHIINVSYIYLHSEKCSTTCICQSQHHLYEGISWQKNVRDEKPLHLWCWAWSKGSTGISFTSSVFMRSRKAPHLPALWTHALPKGYRGCINTLGRF